MNPSERSKRSRSLTLTKRGAPLKPDAGARPLPPLILLTDADRLPDAVAAVRRLPPGAAVVLRDYAAVGRADLARRLRALTRARRILLLIGADPRLAASVGAEGVHWRETDVGRPGSRRGHRRPGWLVTAAAHSGTAIRRAARVGVDAVLVSPVFPTASHPGAPTLGPLRFARLVHASPVPVYALGGIDPRTARRLRNSDAAGFAGIGRVLDLVGS
jgi:thiamine-phosphate pyrophosphorylase